MSSSGISIGLNASLTLSSKSSISEDGGTYPSLPLLSESLSSVGSLFPSPGSSGVDVSPSLSVPSLPVSGSVPSPGFSSSVGTSGSVITGSSVVSPVFSSLETPASSDSSVPTSDSLSSAFVFTFVSSSV